MGRMVGIKWDKAQRCAPIHNIISSDFPKYNPQPWKFMEGNSRMGWLLSNEYQRMWLVERDQWQKRMYPENTTVNIDIVKRYVLTFKTEHAQPKPEIKKPFKMKNQYFDTDKAPTDFVSQRLYLSLPNALGIGALMKYLLPARFERVGSKTLTKRPAGDKAMAYTQKQEQEDSRTKRF